MHTGSKGQAGTIIFLAGLALGLAVALVAVWGDFEGMSYFSTGANYAPFGGLRCPVLIGASEEATVTADLDNPTDKEAQPYYEVEISGPVSSRNLEGQVPVPPRSTRTISWQVNAGDADLGFFVMNKIDLLPYAGYSTREATCGTILVGLDGLSGSQILGWALALSLIGIVGGLAIREGTGQHLTPGERSTRNGLRAAGITALLAMLTALLGWWGIGLLLCAITIILLTILLRLAAD